MQEMQDAMTGASMEQQDAAYAQLKARLQRQVELTVQWPAMVEPQRPDPHANLLLEWDANADVRL